MTDRACFSHLLRHPARKWNGSILTTPEPARGRELQNWTIKYYKVAQQQYLREGGSCSFLHSSFQNSTAKILLKLVCICKKFSSKSDTNLTHTVEQMW